jgi:hypothetical protein
MFPAALLTSRTVIRPITPSDAAAIFDGYAQDHEVTRFLIWKPHRSRDETEDYVARCIAADTAHARTCMLCDPSGSGVRGAMDRRRFSGHRLEFGYVLARRWWGQGLMTASPAAIARTAPVTAPMSRSQIRAVPRPASPGTAAPAWAAHGSVRPASARMPNTTAGNPIRIATTSGMTEPERNGAMNRYDTESVRA